MTRYFRLVSVNREQTDVGERLKGTPEGAARKGFNAWCKKNDKRDRCSATIKVREITRGSNNKEYTYNVARRVWKGDVVDIGGRKVTFKYRTEAYTTKPKPYSLKASRTQRWTHHTA